MANICYYSALCSVEFSKDSVEGPTQIDGNAFGIDYIYIVLLLLVIDAFFPLIRI